MNCPICLSVDSLKSETSEPGTDDYYICNTCEALVPGQLVLSSETIRLYLRDRPGWNQSLPLHRLLYRLSLDHRKMVLAPFFSALNHNNADVRERCLRTLLKLDDHLATDAIIGSLNDPDERVREAAFHCLVNFRHAAMSDFLQNRLDSADNKTREILYRILKERGLEPSERIGADVALKLKKQQQLKDLGLLFMEQELDLLMTGTVDEQEEVLTRLGRTLDKEKIHSILKAMENPNTTLWETLLRIMMYLKHPEPVEPLITLLENGADTVFDQVVKSLGILADVKSLKALYCWERWFTEDNPKADKRMIRSRSEDIVRTIYRIEQKTKDMDEKTVCKQCNCYFSPFSFNPDLFNTIRYMACPVCPMSSFAVGNVSRIILSMDHSDEQESWKRGRWLTVNWFKFNRVFDYDEIHITEAGDFDVEQMVLKLSNDTNEERCLKMPKVPVFIAHGLKLSDNKMNLLKNKFQRISFKS